MVSLISANSISTAIDLSTNNRNVAVDKFPNECPICHYTIQPEQLQGSVAGTAFTWLEIYYRCTHMMCRRHFVCLYDRQKGAHGNFPQAPYYMLRTALPTEPKPIEIDDAVKELSPSFTRIYAQAQAAEEHNLDDIAGPGYRKSLEFLIKDYAIKLKPDYAEKIKTTALATIIKDYLTEDKLNVVSSRATWLGNDETHYEKRWIGKDLADLKKLIMATVHFIAMERLAADLPTDMPR